LHSLQFQPEICSERISAVRIVQIGMLEKMSHHAGASMDGLRAELEGIGIGLEDVEQQATRFQRLAADPCVNLVGFSDGSLSGDGNNDGYSWMVAVVDNGTIQGGGVLAGGGGAVLASDNTNVLLSSTRMEALGLAAGIVRTKLGR
jgi:hypothetical protein